MSTRTLGYATHWCGRCCRCTCRSRRWCCCRCLATRTWQCQHATPFAPHHTQMWQMSMRWLRPLEHGSIRTDSSTPGANATYCSSAASRPLMVHLFPANITHSCRRRCRFRRWSLASHLWQCQHKVTAALRMYVCAVPSLRESQSHACYKSEKSLYLHTTRA